MLDLKRWYDGRSHLNLNMYSGSVCDLVGCGFELPTPNTCFVPLMLLNPN